jgi:hypothetical protein
MRKLALVVTVLFLAFPLVLLILLFLAIEDRPRIDRQVIFTPEHIARAKYIVDAHRFQARPGMLVMTQVRPSDVDLAANYLANRFAKGSAQVALANQSADVRLSLPLQYAPGAYLNIEAKLVETRNLPQPRSVRIGKLPLPDALSAILASELVRWLRGSPEYRIGLDSIHLIKMSPQQLSLLYRWEGSSGGFARELGASVMDKEERERLLRYQTLLSDYSRQFTGQTPLSQVLPSLARQAIRQSKAGDAAAENRAWILVTAFYILGISLEQLLPEAVGWPRPAPHVITLDGRDDFAKHFMVSAAIAAYADTALADAIGLYKEVEDSRSGSGFSFNDLAADRAGTKFGEKSVASKVAAQKLQRRVASGLIDSDLMPAWSDLPEFMPEAEFKRRFGGIDAPAYQRIMQKIEQRVAALSVLH